MCIKLATFKRTFSKTPLTVTDESAAQTRKSWFANELPTTNAISIQYCFGRLFQIVAAATQKRCGSQRLPLVQGRPPLIYGTGGHVPQYLDRAHYQNVSIIWGVKSRCLYLLISRHFISPKRIFHAATTLTANITDCVEAVTSWMRSNRLLLNPGKTEFLWCATVRRQHQLPTSPPPLIDGCSITPVQSARDLGIYTSTATCRCGRMFNDASLRYVSYIRSVALYRRPHFRC